jgi:hypothetical protein
VPAIPSGQWRTKKKTGMARRAVAECVAAASVDLEK